MIEFYLNLCKSLKATTKNIFPWFPEAWALEGVYLTTISFLKGPMHTYVCLIHFSNGLFPDQNLSEFYLNLCKSLKATKNNIFPRFPETWALWSPGSGSSTGLRSETKYATYGILQLNSTVIITCRYVATNINGDSCERIKINSALSRNVIGHLVTN